MRQALKNRPFPRWIEAKRMVAHAGEERTSFPRRALGMLLLAGCGLALPAAAQPPDDGAWRYHAEVFAEIAHGSLINGAANWGSGADVGGGFALRPFPGPLSGLGFEFRAAHLGKDSAGAVTSASLDARLLSAGVVYNFRGGSRVQPYVFGGPGWVTASYSTSCDACVMTKDPVSGQLSNVPYHWQTKATKIGVAGAFGVKIALHRRIWIRPEFLLVDTTAGVGWNWMWIRFQLGAGIHF